MYYCLSCETIHKIREGGEEIFITGWRNVDGKNIPAGFCRRNENQQVASTNSNQTKKS